jgi:hypothetical protein
MRAITRVLHHRHVARVAQRQLIAAAACRLCARSRRGDDVGGNAGEIRRVVDVMRPRVLAVEHVVVELGRQRREFFLHGLEARLVCIPQVGAAEPEVAQRVLDDLAPHVVEIRERRSLRQRTEPRIRAGILRHVGVKCRDLRQRSVVRVADGRRIDDGVQMPDCAPRTVEVVERRLGRRDDVVP